MPVPHTTATRTAALIPCYRAMGVAGIALMTCLTAVRADAQSLREAFQRASQSVVVVHAEQKAVAVPLSSPQPPPQGAPYSQGAGVLIAADGRVLTAAHVVHLASRIEVEFSTGARVAARVVAAAPFADLALLQLAETPPGATVATFGDSNTVAVGDQIFAVGSPYGLNHSLAVGWVSARRGTDKAFENLTALEVIQIDASIYEGNSGGPIFNMDGHVVGIVSHVLVKLGTATGPGFAVASNVARRLILESGRVWFGVETYLVEGPLASLFNVPQDAGLLVQSVATDSLGSQLGLKEGQLRVVVEDQPFIAGGDIVLEMLGLTVRASAESLHEIESALDRLRPGDRVTVKALRAGRVVELTSQVTR